MSGSTKAGFAAKHLWRGATGVARGRKRENAKAGVAAKTLWAWRGAAVAIGEGAAFFSQRLGQPQILRLSRKGVSENCSIVRLKDCLIEILSNYRAIIVRCDAGVGCGLVIALSRSLVGKVRGCDIDFLPCSFRP